MIRFLIVDDESFTREGIIDMIPWDTFGITDVRQAFDGIDAMSIASTFKPDILLTDVRMPRMNGIELAFKIRELYPNCIIIFMSGYSDKEYLKSAIKLKALNYVEKPIELDELKDTLEAAILENSKTKTIYENIENNIALEIINMEKNKDISSIFSSYFSKEFNDRLLNSNFVTVLIKIKDPIMQDKDIFITNLKNIVKLHGFDSFIAFENEKLLIIHLFFPKDKEYLNNEDTFKASFSSISDFLNNLTKHFICVGQTVSSINEIGESYNTACKLIASSFFYDYNSIIFPKIYNTNPYIVNEKIYLIFEEHLLKEDKQNLIILLKRLTNDIVLHPCTSISYVKDIYYKLFLRIVSFSVSINLDILEFSDKVPIFEDLLKFNNIFETEEYLINGVHNLFSALFDKTCSDNPALNVIKYIHDNYSDPDLSLEKISKNTFLTPAYICVIFKNYTEKTVNKYINEYRINKSKTLLNDSNIKINDIASKVGYCDGNYFAKIFRKETGYTPSEFRRNFTR